MAPNPPIWHEATCAAADARVTGQRAAAQGREKLTCCCNCRSYRAHSCMFRSLRSWRASTGSRRLISPPAKNIIYNKLLTSVLVKIKLRVFASAISSYCLRLNQYCKDTRTSIQVRSYKRVRVYLHHRSRIKQ